jgi:plastocyanin
MGVQRAVWVGVVMLLAALAVAGPVVMVSENLRRAEPTAGAEAAATGTTVSMAGLRFSPAQLTVARGTEVLFNNDDSAPHTVTAVSGEVDSGTLGPGRSFRLVVDEPLDYFCAIHPSMEAKVLLSG